MSVIGLIGDYNPQVVAHQAIPHALRLASISSKAQLLQWEWVPSASIGSEPQSRLKEFDGLWSVPASPYKSMEGALAAIRFAREQGVPFLGTCGGFQHALIEYARNVLGIKNAEHAETAPQAAVAVVSLLSCALVEKQDTIFLSEGSRIREIYGQDEITEGYRCRFGLNRDYEPKFNDGKLKFTGHDAAGEVRVMELEGHPFFFGTLFQPERSALKGEGHPLIRAFVSALLGRAGEGRGVTGLID